MDVKRRKRKMTMRRRRRRRRRKREMHHERGTGRKKRLIGTVIVDVGGTEKGIESGTEI
jgi:hypothetical protein